MSDNPFVEYEDMNKHAPGGWLFEILQTAVIALAICVVLWLFVVQGNEVDGQSMEPTFHNKQLVLTDKIIQHFGEYKRGDVVIFKNLTSGNDFIKRVIGVAGDEVSLMDGYVYVNGVKIEEPYLPSDRRSYGESFLTNGASVKVPEGKYFVMGDNRGNSMDSRHNSVAFVDRKEFKGRVFLVYWPPKSDNLGLVNRLDYKGLN